MATPGTYISAVGHVGLIGWLLLGIGLDSEPLEFNASDVSIISGEAFEAMMAAAQSPDPGPIPPATLEQPVIDETPPPAPISEDPATQAPPPEQVDPPDSEVPPPQPPDAAPVTEVTDAPPVAPTPPVAPPPAPDLEVSDDPTPEQADVITSAPPQIAPPDAREDDVTLEALVPDESETPEVEQEPQEATAAPETTTEIVTEAEEPSAPETPSTLVATSVRPILRPARAAQQEIEEPETETTAADPEPAEVEPPADDAAVDDAVAAALAAAAGGRVEGPAPRLGQGLSASEIGSVESAIGRKWTVDPAARRVRDEMLPSR